MNPGRAFLGGLLAVTGLLFLAGQAGWLDAGTVVVRGWPLVIVALGLLQLILDPGTRVASLVVVGVGLALLAATTGAFGADVWRVVLPVGLIALGIWVVVGRRFRSSRNVTDDRPQVVVAFASRRYEVTSDGLGGGSASVFFGAAEVDLRQAEPSRGGAHLGATVVFGSLYIIVPEGWRVVTHGVPIVGGLDDTTRRDAVPAEAPRLDVGGLVLFGGLEVRHERRWG